MSKENDMTNETTTVSQELQTAIVKIDNSTPTDALADVLNRLAAYMERGKELKELLEAKLLDRVIETGPVEIGTVRYYAGVKKTTKCTNVPGAVEALLVLSGGDFGKLCEAFASQPLKHGYCKQVMGGRFEEFFKVEEEQELKEGKAKPQLQKIDTRFIR